MAGFQQVKVNRDLEFTGHAATTPNIKGPAMSELKIFDTHFAGTSTLYGWASTTGNNGGTLSTSAVDGGAMLMTCGSSTTDCLELYHTAQWSPYHSCGMEAKLKVSGITQICIAAGFVDAPLAGDNHVGLELSGDTQYNNTATVHDNCGMTFDTEATNDYWYYSALENNTIRAPVVAGAGALVPVADTYFRVRVQTDRSGNVWFYYNGANVGHISGADSGVASAVTDLLTPFIGIISRTTDAWVATVSRITTWQECS